MWRYAYEEEERHIHNFSIEKGFKRRKEREKSYRALLVYNNNTWKMHRLDFCVTACDDVKVHS